MATSFRPATRENVPLLIGLTSGTGGGKTFSAMRMAAGIVGPGKRFAVVDTERRRARHYADDFAFDIADLEPPFTPERCIEAIQEAARAGYGAIVFDSATHEWAGEGGVLQMHDQAVDRMAGANADWRKREAMNWPAWRQPKLAHAVFREGLLQVGVPLVLCFRGKSGQKPGVDPETGKKCMVETPFRPITSQDDLVFELTTLLVLSQEKPGTVDLSQPNKIGKPVRHLVRDGAQLDESFGAALAAWARGGEQPAAAPPPKRRTLGDAAAELRARVEAAHDTAALDEVLAADETGKVLAALGDRAAELNALIAARLQLLQTPDGGSPA